MSEIAEGIRPESVGVQPQPALAAVERVASASNQPLPGNITPLWTVADVARFLQRSERWVYDALATDPNKPGSLPFIRIPGGRGSRGQGSARFVPADIVAWVAAGCPPATVFRTWQEVDKRGRRKSA